jgi:hypothetical protein
MLPTQGKGRAVTETAAPSENLEPVIALFSIYPSWATGGNCADVLPWGTRTSCFPSVSRREECPHPQGSGQCLAPLAMEEADLGFNWF